MISFPPLARGKLAMITAPCPPPAYSSNSDLLLLSLCSVTSGCEFAFSAIPHLSSSLHCTHMPTILPFHFSFYYHCHIFYRVFSERPNNNLLLLRRGQTFSSCAPTTFCFNGRSSLMLGIDATWNSEEETANSLAF